MVYEFLHPVSEELVQFVEKLPAHAIGNTVKLHTEYVFPDLSDVNIVLVAVNDSRSREKEAVEEVDFDVIRKKFYRLFPGNWTAKIADIGTIKAGETIDDTYFVVRKITEDLLKKKILPVFIGASQDVTYAIYRAYDVLEQMVNLTTIDSKIDVVADIVNPSESYISRIIIEEPNNLLNFSNLGFQTYFNSQEEIDLIQKMYFEAYRLGDLIQDPTLAEPVLRDSDIVSLDIHAVRGADLGLNNPDFPNGFDGREVCILARYAGLSDRVSTFGVFNLCKNSEKSLLISQILWYFVEGYNYRMNEYPYISKKSYYKYIVPLQDQELVFYKSDISERWWIEIETAENQQKGRKILFPCSQKDYQKALENEIPERWWRASRKIHE